MAENIQINFTGTGVAYKVGYRLKGSTDPFNYITPNPTSSPVTISAVPNGNYEAEITQICASGAYSTAVIIDGTVTIPPFDYLVVRYRWTQDGGQDLDTITGFVNTGFSDVDNKWAGYGQNSNPGVPQANADADKWLLWGQDNTGSGIEAVLLRFNKLVADKPSIGNLINVSLNANWYNTKLNGNITLELTAYSGGVMTPDTPNYNFINTGGSQVFQQTFSNNVYAYERIEGVGPLYTDHVGNVSYNKTTREAILTVITDQPGLDNGGGSTP